MREELAGVVIVIGVVIIVIVIASVGGISKSMVVDADDALLRVALDGVLDGVEGAALVELHEALVVEVFGEPLYLVVELAQRDVLFALVQGEEVDECGPVGLNERPDEGAVECDVEVVVDAELLAVVDEHDDLAANHFIDKQEELVEGEHFEAQDVLALEEVLEELKLLPKTCDGHTLLARELLAEAHERRAEEGLEEEDVHQAVAVVREH